MPLDAPNRSRGARPKTPSLPRILKITYGGMEMTGARAFAMAEASLNDSTNKTPFFLENSTFEMDPKPGEVKSATVTILGPDGENETTLHATEYDTLYLGVGAHLYPPGECPIRPGEPAILEVMYGPKRIEDPKVLARLRKSLEDFAVGFHVTNQNLGGDPQVGLPKKCSVTVIYWDGRKVTKGAWEHMTMYLADGSEKWKDIWANTDEEGALTDDHD